MKPSNARRLANVVTQPLPSGMLVALVSVMGGLLLGTAITAFMMAEDHDKGHWVIEFGVGKGVVIAVAGWILTFFIAQFVYNQFQRRQVQIARMSSVVKFEDDMLALHAGKTARRIYRDASAAGAAGQDGSPVELRFVLDDQPWVIRTRSMVGGSAQVAWKAIDGQRFWFIREGGLDERPYDDYVSSKAFHETLSWFRKISRAHQEEIIRDDDLVHLWRQILPFSYCNRLAYFTQYFQGEESVRELIDIVQSTLDRVAATDLKKPAEHFRILKSPEDEAILLERARSRSLDGRAAR